MVMNRETFKEAEYGLTKFQHVTKFGATPSRKNIFTQNNWFNNEESFFSSSFLQYREKQQDTHMDIYLHSRSRTQVE